MSPRQVMTPRVVEDDTTNRVGDGIPTRTRITSLRPLQKGLRGARE
jgi:hypothetical protein